MSGVSFPDPIPRNFMSSSSKKEMLVLTNYGTIKGQVNFKEQSINEFIAKIEKNIDDWKTKLDEDTYKHTIKNNSIIIITIIYNFCSILNSMFSTFWNNSFTRRKECWTW